MYKIKEFSETARHKRNRCLMSKCIVLDKIPFHLDGDKLAARIHLPKDDCELCKSWENLRSKVESSGQPKAIYRDCTVDEITEDTVVVDGVPLKSRVMGHQLGERKRLFAYCATCGTETRNLEDTAEPLERFWLEELRLSMLHQALEFMHSEIKRRYSIPKISWMAPGSGDASVWPINEQTKLFGQLLGGIVTETIGVVLTDSMLMLPYKSTSGVIFAAEHDFATCRLCHREHCPNRRAPFDADLWKKTQPDWNLP